MSTIHLLDVGFNEPTIVYELTPKKIGEYSGLPLAGVIEMLKSIPADNIIVDSGPYKDEINEALLVNGFNLLIVKGRLSHD